MDEVLDDIDTALGAGLHFVALMGAVAVPDICAALGSENGRTSGPKYVAWVKENLSDHWTYEDRPQLLYEFRCSLLHQGSLLGRRPTESPRLFFLEPGPQAPNISGSLQIDFPGRPGLMMNLVEVVTGITSAARKWKAAVEGTQRYQRNWDRAVHRHAEGLPPYFGGYPVIG